mgnify:CR=1 FL=1
MDSARRSELIGQLVDMRRIPAHDTDTRTKLIDGDLHRLTKSLYLTAKHGTI